ncbi:FH2 domain-containing protein 1-like [Balamuthia mandrillaris]
MSSQSESEEEVSSEQGGPLPKSYTVYEIMVVQQPSSWIILRRYAQFCTLHNKLKQKYGGVMKPASKKFPSSGFLSNLTGNAEKRHIKLQAYLNALLDIPHFQQEVPMELKMFLTTDQQPIEDYVHVLDDFMEDVDVFSDLDGESSSTLSGSPLTSRRPARKASPFVHATLRRTTGGATASAAAAGTNGSFVGAREMSTGPSPHKEQLGMRQRGPLYKLSDKGLWKKQFFQYIDGNLFKYSAPSDTHPKGMYSLAGAKIQRLTEEDIAKVDEKAEQQFCFRICFANDTTSKKELVLATPNGEALDVWLKALQSNLYDKNTDIQVLAPKREGITASPSTSKRKATRLKRKRSSESVTSFLEDLLSKYSCTAIALNKLEREVVDWSQGYGTKPLPEPLLTYDLNLSFLALHSIKNSQHRQSVLLSLLQCLPTLNLQALCRLLRYMHCRLQLEPQLKGALTFLFGKNILVGEEFLLGSEEFEREAIADVASLLLENYSPFFVEEEGSTLSEALDKHEEKVAMQHDLDEIRKHLAANDSQTSPLDNEEKEAPKTQKKKSKKSGADDAAKEDPSPQTNKDEPAPLITLTKAKEQTAKTTSTKPSPTDKKRNERETKSELRKLKEAKERARKEEKERQKREKEAALKKKKLEKEKKKEAKKTSTGRRHTSPPTKGNKKKGKKKDNSLKLDFSSLSTSDRPRLASPMRAQGAAGRRRPTRKPLEQRRVPKINWDNDEAWDEMKAVDDESDEESVVESPSTLLAAGNDESLSKNELKTTFIKSIQEMPTGVRSDLFQKIRRASTHNLDFPAADQVKRQPTPNEEEEEGIDE